LFLTPTDVWTGTLRFANGAVEIYSTDDSVLTSAGVFASPTNPLVKTLINPLRATCLPSAEPFGNMLGYMVLLEQAHSDGTPASTAYPYPRGGVGTVNLNLPPVPKLALFEAYSDFLAAAGIPAPTQGTPGTNPLVMDGINVLSGSLEFRNTISGQSASLNAVTLRDYDNQLPVGYGQSIGFAAGCGYAGGTGVTAAAPAINPALGGISIAGCQAGGGAVFTKNGVTWSTPVACTPGVVNVGGTTGCGTTLAGLGSQTNSVGEVEAALAKDWLAMPFTSSTASVHLLTFPTKQTIRNNTDCYYVSSPSPFFSAGRVGQPVAPGAPLTALAARPTTYAPTWEGWGCFPYQTVSYDMSEKSSSVTSIFSPGGQPQNLCGELNFLSGFAFSEGWAVYNFNNAGLGAAPYSTPYDTQADINPNPNAPLAAPWVVYDAAYTGAPVIGTVLSLGADGFTLAQGTYADGEVRFLGADGAVGGVGVNADLIYHYAQYWDSANVNDVANGFVLSPTGNGGYDAVDESGCIGGVPCAVNNTLKASTGGTVYHNKFTGNRLGFNVWGVLGWPAGAGGIAPGPATAVFDGQTP